MVKIMFNFFADENSRQGDCFFITGSDLNHIKNVLRMRIGDTILVSENGKSHLCGIEALTEDTAIVRITEESFKDTELPVKLYLFQGLPKSDKMELIIQKAVELGVYAVIPTEMSRCVVKLEDKKKKSKIQRWQAISESAAKQSKRNIIPEVMNVMSYGEALQFAKNLDVILVPYEAKDGMLSTKKALSEISPGKSVGIFIGPEGGFDDKEIEKALTAGGEIISLGKRILRTETAAITALSMCMLYIEMNENGENG